VKLNETVSQSVLKVGLVWLRIHDFSIGFRLAFLLSFLTQKTQKCCGPCIYGEFLSVGQGMDSVMSNRLHHVMRGRKLRHCGHLIGVQALNLCLSLLKPLAG
jgi:hypothetical protein